MDFLETVEMEEIKVVEVAPTSAMVAIIATSKDHESHFKCSQTARSNSHRSPSVHNGATLTIRLNLGKISPTWGLPRLRGFGLLSLLKVNLIPESWMKGHG